MDFSREIGIPFAEKEKKEEFWKWWRGIFDAEREFQRKWQKIIILQAFHHNLGQIPFFLFSFVRFSLFPMFCEMWYELRATAVQQWTKLINSFLRGDCQPCHCDSMSGCPGARLSNFGDLPGTYSPKPTCPVPCLATSLPSHHNVLFGLLQTYEDQRASLL